MILILLGDGVNAAVLLKRSKTEGSGWMIIIAGWAFAVLCGIFTVMLFGSKDGHLNPAITKHPYAASDFLNSNSVIDRRIEFLNSITLGSLGSSPSVSSKRVRVERSNSISVGEERGIREPECYDAYPTYLRCPFTYIFNLHFTYEAQAFASGEDRCLSDTDSHRSTPWAT